MRNAINAILQNTLATVLSVFGLLSALSAPFASLLVTYGWLISVVLAVLFAASVILTLKSAKPRKEVSQTRGVFNGNVTGGRMRNIKGTGYDHLVKGDTTDADIDGIDIRGREE